MTRRAKMGPRTRMAEKLRAGGKKYREIASEMGVGISAVSSLLGKARRHREGGARPVGRPRGPDVDARWDVERPRCKCGLRMPCNSCVWTIEDYAGMRR